VGLLRYESIALISCCVTMVMDVFTRSIIEFSIEPAEIDDLRVRQMFNSAIAGHTNLRHLSSDFPAASGGYPADDKIRPSI
jgi:hypothetical protein